MNGKDRELREQALRLPTNQRIDLAAVLLDSVEGEPEPGAEEAWLEEVRRRAHQLDAGEATALPIEELFRNLAD
jgi:putative addiction module component (TIGR02574 family)